MKRPPVINLQRDGLAVSLGMVWTLSTGNEVVNQCLYDQRSRARSTLLASSTVPAVVYPLCSLMT